MDAEIQAEVYKSQRLAAEMMASQTRILELLSKSSGSGGKSAHQTSTRRHEGVAVKKSGDDAAAVKKPGKDSKASNLSCDICKTTFTGELQKAHHFKAGRHRKTVAEYTRDHGIMFDGDKPRCTMCKIPVDSEFLSHHVGMPAHLEAKAAHDKEIAATSAPQVFTASGTAKVEEVTPQPQALTTEPAALPSLQKEMAVAPTLPVVNTVPVFREPSLPTLAPVHAPAMVMPIVPQVPVAVQPTLPMFTTPPVVPGLFTGSQVPAMPAFQAPILPVGVAPQ